MSNENDPSRPQQESPTTPSDGEAQPPATPPTPDTTQAHGVTDEQSIPPAATHATEAQPEMETRFPPTAHSRRSFRSRFPAHRIATTQLVKAYLYDVWRLLQEAKIPLIGFVLLTSINVAYLTLSYNHPECLAFAAGHPQACLSLPRAIFETMRMFVFEVNIEWPEHHPIGQLLFFLTPILGVALLFQSVLDFSRHLLDKGSRREAWQISLARTFRDHVIICGLGRVSYRIMTQLLETGYEVVVIEHDWNSEFVPDALKLRVPVVVGDFTDTDVLLQAGLTRASGIIAGTSDDLLNIEVALTARRQHEDIQVVMRIFNDDLDRNLEQIFGPNTAFSSSALGAPTMAVAAVSCSIASVLPLEHTVLGIAEITIAPDSQLASFGGAIEENYHVRFLQWLDPRGCWSWPEPGLRLSSGDVVLLLGSIENLERLAQDNQPGSQFAVLQPERPLRAAPPINTVIVCGLGRVGYRVVRALAQREPQPEIVVICENAASNLFVKHIQDEPGIHIIAGDARVAEVLQQAGIATAYSIAAVTSNNLTNIQIGLEARRLRPEIDVVLRVFSAMLAEQLDTIFGMYTAFSTSALAAPTLAAAAVEPGISYALNIGGRLLSTTELPMQNGDMFVGKTIEQVYAAHKAIVVSLRRGQQRTIMPAPHVDLQAGDTVEVLADISMIAQLSAQGRRGTRRKSRKLIK